ncbi:hypothetical protein [Pontibacter sp. H249]|uniref:hypothetical protein n=1 Tax=Pontibacter sp. H249 TaxID=3133420 RepID=UPI0030BD5012
MSKLFATGFDRAMAWEGYPLTLAISLSPSVVQALYFERVYSDIAGNQLAIRSTLIPERGLLWLTESGPFPVGTHRMQVCVTNQNRATEADPVLDVPETIDALPKFATAMEVPRLFGEYPLQLSMGVGSTRQMVYLEREYLDARRQTLGIRSDLVHERSMLVGFNIHVPEPLAGTRYINVCLTNQYRATEQASTLEYNVLEYNELEYN